jgi:ribosomal protein L40E
MSLVTFGLYTFYWLFKTFKEVRGYRGEGVSGVIGTVLTMLVIGWFLLPRYVGRMYEEDGQLPPISGLRGYLIFVPYFGGLLWIAAVQGALNDFVPRNGAGRVLRPKELEAQRQRDEYGEQKCQYCGAFSSLEATHCRKCRQPLSRPA